MKNGKFGFNFVLFVLTALPEFTTSTSKTTRTSFIVTPIPNSMPMRKFQCIGQDLFFFKKIATNFSLRKAQQWLFRWVHRKAQYHQHHRHSQHNHLRNQLTTHNQQHLFHQHQQQQCCQHLFLKFPIIIALKIIIFGFILLLVLLL